MPHATKHHDNISRTIIAAMLILCPVVSYSAKANPAPAEYSIVPIEKGAILFTPSPDYYDESGQLETWAHPNANGKLICEADVGTVAFPTTSLQTYGVNRTIREMAENYRCSIDSDYSAFVPKVTYLDADVASIIATTTVIGRGGNGSCHSHNEYINIELKTGRQYRLSDILRSDMLPKVRQDILAYFQSDAEIKQEDVGKIIDSRFWSMGFFIKDHKLYVDMNSYLKSCVDGPFFPVEISPAYLDPQHAPSWLEKALK